MVSPSNSTEIQENVEATNQNKFHIFIHHSSLITMINVYSSECERKKIFVYQIITLDKDTDKVQQ